MTSFIASMKLSSSLFSLDVHYVCRLICCMSRISFASIFSFLAYNQLYRGGSRISRKGVHMYKCVGVCFADLSDFISFFLNYPMKMK